MRNERLIPAALLAAALACGCEDDTPEKPPGMVTHPSNSSELIEMLASTYHQRSYSGFANLFPDDAEAPFRFTMCEPLPDGHAYWGREEELQIHRRMFEPDNVLPGENPIPQEYRVVDIGIALIPLGDWSEPTDLYMSPANPSGLDPSRWRASEAEYHAEVLWMTRLQYGYRVSGRQRFVVIEDLANPVDAGDRRFLLYRWEDLGNYAGLAASESKCWSQVKALYLS